MSGAVAENERHAQDEVVVGIDVAIETELPPGGVPALVGEVEIAALRGAIGEHLAAGHAERFHRAVPQAVVEDFVRFLLDGMAGAREERPVLHFRRGFGEVGEDADAAAFGGREDGAEQPCEAEGREVAVGRIEIDGCGFHGLEYLRTWATAFTAAASRHSLSAGWM